ncbi:MAG: SUMF1/EgtB/PvdO family nonheme iron enzyme [Phycisphaeraceae bacterium]|nr:SUMF1/EgtB/PvdO family nonheme iron enzyme [Phycisphaeraceae bacterium]
MFNSLRFPCFSWVFLSVILVAGERVLHAQTAQQRISPTDGAAQVLIPGGEFFMGADDPEAPLADEQRPSHAVKLSAFWMDQYEVTCEQFARYLNQMLEKNAGQWTDRQCFELVHGYILIEHPQCGLTFDPAKKQVTVKTGKEKFPAMPVAWNAAHQYALSVGRQLPTEAQWEYAACGTDGRRYPWGNDWNPSLANVHTQTVAAVDAFPGDCSPFGVIGLAGNVREWVRDVFSLTWYATSPRQDPANLSIGNTWERVIRGGSFLFTEWDARATSRYYGTVNDGIAPAVGFRTVEPASP